MFWNNKNTGEKDEASEIVKAFAKIQTGLEIFLVNQVKERGWDVDRSVVKDSMCNLISALPVGSINETKHEVLIAILRAAPEMLDVFCHAIRVKLALLAESGSAGEGFKIVRNLQELGIRAVHIDEQPLPSDQLVALANDFVLICNTLEAQKVEIDEDWAYSRWNGGEGIDQLSIGDLATVSPHPLGRQQSMPRGRDAFPNASWEDSGGSIGEQRTFVGNGLCPLSSHGAELEDRYSLEEELGRGSYGVVYRAHDRLLNRPVAIKLLGITDSRGGGVTQRHLREAQAAAALNHPGIVQIYDFHVTNESACIVMEYVQGSSLRRILRNGVLSVTDACRVNEAICKAMHYAHRNGVLHRDLKPENVLCDEALEEVKVVDFGLAKVIDSATLTTTGKTMGTLPYMAPEQLSDGKSVDRTADIFAIGKMIYETLTGDIPISVEIDRLPEDCGIREIVSRCTRFSPFERYQSVQDLLDAIIAVRRGHDTGGG